MKFFTLLFDGGRKDPYHIIERWGNFCGSIWVSAMDLQWLTRVWDKLCKITDQPEGFFQSFRDGYRILEISCMKNKRGRFVELSDYHSGSQQGHIRIPEGKKRGGWDSFVKELRQFFLGCRLRLASLSGCAAASRAEASKISNQDLSRNSRFPLNGESRRLGGDFAKSAGIMLNGRNSVFERIDFSQPHLPRVQLVEGGPRSTCHHTFLWNLAHRTLHITKEEGGKRAMSWVDVNSRPNELHVALGPLKQPVAIMPLSPDAKPIKPTKPNHRRKIRSKVEPVGQWGLPSFFSCLDLDSCYEKGEASCDSQASEISALVSPAMISLVTRKFKERWSLKSSASATMEALDHYHAPTDTTKLPATPISVSHTSVLRLVLFSDDDTIDARRPIQSVALVANHGGQFEGEEKRSKWLDTQYRRFSKQVGVSITGFENQCYSLLRRIDEERTKKLKDLGPRQSSVSGKKFVRELKRLTSFMNYEGKHVCF